MTVLATTTLVALARWVGSVIELFVVTPTVDCPEHINRAEPTHEELVPSRSEVMKVRL